MGDQRIRTDAAADQDRLARYGIVDSGAEPGFDDAVLLARELCDTPVALVTLMADDEVWFKGRRGFEASAGDRDQSLCCFVVDEGAPVIIPDLTADPRTADNVQVTPADGIRFYAGAPLIVEDGSILGSICVIDTQPRPGGLTAAQRRQLEALARSVSQQLDLRRALLDRDRAVVAEAALQARNVQAEERWRDLFQTMHEGFLIGTLVRDDEGRVIDWRYDEVNRAWGELVGMDHRAAKGRTVRELFPDIEDEWVQEPLRAVEHGENLRFTRQVGTLQRWYDGVMQPTVGDSFLVLFVEVTERVQEQHRTAALIEIADRIRESRSVGDMTSATAAIVGRVLGASRAGYGHVDTDTERVEIEPDWTVDGETSIAGKHRFADFGQIRDELARAEPLVITDVEIDPRTAADPGPMRALNIGALVNMPVRDGGRTIAVFIVQSATPRAWTAAELSFIRNVADRLESGIARLRAEAQQQMVNGEIAHRLKNSLAMVQAIANQTLRGVTDPDRLTAFQERLRALGTAHEALLDRGLLGGNLGDVVRRVIDAAGVTERCTAEGPDVLLGARATLSTSLLLHELATNALKYGALSADGTVAIRWYYRADDSDQLRLEWVERGGPTASAPTRRGFGSRLLSLGLVGTGGATIDYEPQGVSARFDAAKNQLEHA